MTREESERLRPRGVLGLPAEIRNIIFRILLTHNTPIIARSCNSLKPPWPLISLGLTPSICLVSRATHSEATSILYGENVFQAHPTFLDSCVFSIDPERPILSARCISKIRKWHIRVRLDCDPYYKSEDVAQTFTNAAELEVEVFRASWGMGSYDNLNGFTKIRGVGRARVHGSLEETYASWLEGVMSSAIGAQVESWNEWAVSPQN